MRLWLDHYFYGSVYGWDRDRGIYLPREKLCKALNARLSRVFFVAGGFAELSGQFGWEFHGNEAPFFDFVISIYNM